MTRNITFTTYCDIYIYTLEYIGCMAGKTAYMRKEYRDHQLQMQILKTLACDPELKYFLGMAAGAGVGWVGAMLNQVTETPAPEEPTDEQQKAIAALQKVAYGYLAIQYGGLSGFIMEQTASKLGMINWADGSSGKGLADQMGNILAMGGTGFAATCAMILILKSIFNGTDLGEMLSGVGEIMPL